MAVVWLMYAIRARLLSLMPAYLPDIELHEEGVVVRSLARKHGKASFRSPEGFHTGSVVRPSKGGAMCKFSGRAQDSTDSGLAKSCTTFTNPFSSPVS